VLFIVIFFLIATLWGIKMNILSDKPEEHILNIIVQGSDNKILLIKTS